MTALKKVTRTEYQPTAIDAMPGKVVSEIVTYFHENGKVAEETLHTHAPLSFNSRLVKHYDESWNLEAEYYYENGYLVASASAFGVEVVPELDSRAASRQLPDDACDAFAERPMFYFAMSGKKKISEEMDIVHRRIIKRTLSKVMNDLVYLREELFEYY